MAAACGYITCLHVAAELACMWLQHVLVHLTVELVHVAAELVHVAAELVHVTAELVHVATELVHVTADIVHVATELVHVATELIHVATELVCMWLSAVSGSKSWYSQYFCCGCLYKQTLARLVVLEVIWFPPDGMIVHMHAHVHTVSERNICVFFLISHLDLSR